MSYLLVNVDIMSVNLALANFFASFFLRIMWRFRLTFKVKPSDQGIRKKERCRVRISAGLDTFFVQIYMDVPTV